MSNYIEVREPGTNHLLFRYDPNRELVEIKNRDRITVIDLQEIKPPKGGQSKLEEEEKI